MDRVVISLLLASLCVVSSWTASSDKQVVTQTPDVSVMEGEMVKITCCWTENSERAYVFWLKSQTGNKEDLYMKDQVFQKKEENNCSSLIFPRISREDAGTYICKVFIEIPRLTTAHGDGTIITVKEKTSDNTTGDTVIGASSDKQVVTQTPDVSVMEGEMVTITCCWTGNSERALVFWLKSRTGNKEDLYMKEQARVFHTKEEYYCSFLIFRSISREDAGTYICRVYTEIPHLSIAHGDGTIITVTFKEKTSDNTTGDKVSGASSDKQVVTQTPDVSVMEGEMVMITCCWTGNSERAHVSWLKSQTGNKEDLYMKEEVFQKKEEYYCSSLTFPSISREDAGTYICRVTIEIPHLSMAEGDGTVITVTSDNTTGDKVRNAPLKPELIYVLRCLPIVALILTFFCLYHFRTRAQKRTSAAPGNEPTWAQRREEEKEEEERDDRVIEAAGE